MKKDEKNSGYDPMGQPEMENCKGGVNIFGSRLLTWIIEKLAPGNIL